MREFMTKVSDFIDERRNDPEKNGSFLVLCVIGMAMLVSIVLCLLLLWHKNGNGEQNMKAEVFEETPDVMLTENPVDEELKMQYLTDIEYFEEKIKELSGSMTRISEMLETTTAVSMEENPALREQIKEIGGSITGLLTKLQNTQSTLHDLNDLVNVMDEKTIPLVQGQIVEIEKHMGFVSADISDIYGKIDELETTDRELKIKIREIQGALKSSVEQNVTDITNRFESMSHQIQQLLAQFEDARQKLNDTQNQVEDTKKQLGDTQNQVEDTRKQLGDTQNQVEDTRKQLGDTQGQVEDTRKQLDNTQDRLSRIDAQMLRYRYDETDHTLYLYENE